MDFFMNHVMVPFADGNIIRDTIGNLIINTGCSPFVC